MPGHRVGLAFAASAAFALGACAGAPTPAPPAARPAKPPAPSADAEGIPPRPADAEADVAYYRERAEALTSETTAEIARTDFVRMRRGRLYFPESGDTDTVKIEMALGKALEKNDNAAMVELTGKILLVDQADIRAHILRAVALRRLGRTKEADFHREAGIGLIESIVRGGDGRSFDTAWTVFRVKEEYEVLKAGGYVVERQSLAAHGNRHFDILEARKVEGGPTIRAHFDITELFAEEGRAFGAR